MYYTLVIGNIHGDIKLEIRSTALTAHCCEELSFCCELLETAIAKTCHENDLLLATSMRLNRLSLTRAMVPIRIESSVH